jgi:hypothetical protein
MTLLVRWIVGVIAAAGLGFLAWKPVEAAYFTKCSALESKIEKLRDDIRLCEDGLEKRSGLDAALEGFVNRTFGGDLETVDHRLRSRLNRIGESLELTDLTVGTAKSRSVASPARTVFSNRRQKTLRDEIDFVELEGWVAGRGTLEQALRLVHWIEAEPWPKRIYDVRLEPKEAGKAFNVNVRFITIFLPGRAPDEIAESEVGAHRRRDGTGRRRGLAAQRRDRRVPEPDGRRHHRKAGPGLGHWRARGVRHGREDRGVVDRRAAPRAVTARTR